MFINKDSLRATSAISGFIIGAGIFAVAFSWSQAGYFVGVAELIVITLIILIAHLMFGEVLLRTEGHHRLPGLAALYLGAGARKIAVITNVLGAFGALLAYTIIGGTFMWELAGAIFPIGLFAYQILFFAFMSILVISGLRLAAKVELILTALLILTILFIVGWAMPNVRTENFFIKGHFYNIFLPFGVLIFSLGGWAAIPEAKEILNHNLRRLKGVIIWGSLMAAAVTALFGSVVLGVSGSNTTESSIEGLRPILGLGIVTLGAVFGVLAIATSFIVLGIYVKETLQYDFKLPKESSLVLTIGVPLALFLLGVRSFINVISLTGGVFGVLDVILIMLIYRVARLKGKRKPEYVLRIPGFVLWFMIAAFALGAVYEIVRVITF